MAMSFNACSSDAATGFRQVAITIFEAEEISCRTYSSPIPRLDLCMVNVRDARLQL